jgi:hypothetical protein
VDDFKPKAGDPLHEPGEGSHVGQFGAKGGRVRAGGDLAVVELCAQRSVCLADESGLICAWWHWITPHSWWLTLAASVPGGRVRVVTRFRVIGVCRDNRDGLRLPSGPAPFGDLHPLLSCPAAAPRLCWPGSSSPPVITTPR